MLPFSAVCLQKYPLLKFYDLPSNVCLIFQVIGNSNKKILNSISGLQYPNTVDSYSFKTL